MNKSDYWNREEFEGLTSLSAALRTESCLEQLAAYCDLREKGLRREALTRLNAFIEQMRCVAVPDQRALAVHVLESHWRFPQAYRFLAVPLRNDFLERVLKEWRAADAKNPVPLRYLALLCRDGDLLEEALRRNPQDDHVRATLAGDFIDMVDYATHHLAEGEFIGDEDEAFAALAKADSLLSGAVEPSSVRALRHEVDELAGLLADWKQYREAPEGTFPEWCLAQNRDHHWRSTVYYDGGAD